MTERNTWTKTEFLMLRAAARRGETIGTAGGLLCALLKRHPRETVVKYMAAAKNDLQQEDAK